MERQVKAENNRTPSADCAENPSQPTIDTTNPHPSIGAERGPMKLIPWEDIWRSLHDARIRGHGEMIQVFYETLFKEAVFDDDGAWSQEQARHN